jgi:hypothetical protein
VQACRFEQGDVLYSDREDYEAGASAEPPRCHIQIFEPTRSTRALSGDSEGRRFHANWDSPVTLEYTDPHPGRAARPSERETIETTQGRLFTCLWRGDVGWLTPESGHPEAPAPPLLLRDLHSRLGDAMPALRKRASRSKWATHLFAQAFDDSNDASRIKSRATLELLESRYRTRCVDLSPEQAGLSDADRFHPTLVIRGMVLEAPDEDHVRDTLKGLLYRGGSGNSDAGDEVGAGAGVAVEVDARDKAATDRFQLARHGVLVQLG